MDRSHAGKIVIVTGASSGIGAALAEAYGREGARVALTYRRNRDAADRVAAAVVAAGGEALVLPFDLADPSSATALSDAVIERWQRIDVLVANAVAWPERSVDGRFEGLGREAWETGLRVNVEGTFALVQAVLPPMRAARWGRVLFISSGLAEEGMPGAETYTTAKSAIHGLARSLAWNAGRDGILVNVLSAGLTLTESNRTRIPEHVLEQVASRVPLGRLSDPRDLAGPALFLTSGANTSITGELIREGSATGRSSHTS